MRVAWAEDEAEYHGEHVDFDPLWSWPKPVRRPHPPVLVGGNGPGVEDRVLAFGDGWMPQCAPLASVEELAGRATRLRLRAAQAGRERPSVTLFGVPNDPVLVKRFAEAEVDRCLFPVRADDEGELLKQLDEAAALLG